MKLAIPTEAAEQESLFTWWRLAARGFGVDPRLMFMIPNGAYLGAGQTSKGVSLAVIRFKKLQRQGFVQGVPDIFLAAPRGAFHGLFIELKRRDGGVVSDEQNEFVSLALLAGYMVGVCAGFDEARRLITTYLSEPIS